MLCQKIGDGHVTAQSHHDNLLSSNDQSIKIDDHDKVTQKSLKDLLMIDDSNLSMSRCPETSITSVTHIIEDFYSRLSCHLPNANVTCDSLTDNQYTGNKIA